MASDPRTIKGPCFDCEEDCDCAQYVWMCDCHFRDGELQFRGQEQTAPTPKLEPETRPNDVMMTDEQYIDSLFQQEPCGYQNTPGFRAFLDAMATIGKRPRTGDVATMHMAYTAGQEHGIARTWTDEQPTEPGEYWAALHPDQRERLWASQTMMCVVIARNEHGGFLSVRWFDSDREECSLSLDDLLFDGAKWSRRETPADPFEVTR